MTPYNIRLTALSQSALTYCDKFVFLVAADLSKLNSRHSCYRITNDVIARMLAPGLTCLPEEISRSLQKLTE